MVPYEELCEALERCKRRQQNQAELDNLNEAPAPAPAPVARAGVSSTAETFALKARDDNDERTSEPETTHEIDVNDVELD